ncbi:unnamed protein product, partial [Gulo gulo]
TYNRVCLATHVVSFVTDCETSSVCEASAVNEVCPVLSLGAHQKARGCPHGAFGRAIRGVGRGPDGRGAHPVPPELSAQPSGDSVTLSESTAIISHGTTGLVTWDAALYLAEWAIENPAAFAHRCAVLPRNCPLPGQSPTEALCLPEEPAGS